MATSNQQHQYEAMFLYGPSAATDLDGAINHCRQIIERHGGQVILIKKWDERKLAYEVEKQKRGTYIIAYYRGPGAAVGGIARDVNLSEQVLRVMVTRADHLNEQEMAAVEPQPIVKQEERREWTERLPEGVEAAPPSRPMRRRRSEEAPAEAEGGKVAERT